MIDSTIVRAHQHSAGAQKKTAKIRRSGAAKADFANVPIQPLFPRRKISWAAAVGSMSGLLKETAPARGRPGPSFIGCQGRPGIRQCIVKLARLHSFENTAGILLPVGCGHEPALLVGRYRAISWCVCVITALMSSLDRSRDAATSLIRWRIASLNSRRRAIASELVRQRPAARRGRHERAVALYAEPTGGKTL
jgi:hypothetical protein